MRMGFGQFVCLLAGVLFLSLGGGLIGGRWAIQRQGLSVSKHTGGAAQSLEEPRAAEPVEAGLPELEPGAALDDVPVSPSTTVEQRQLAPFSQTPPKSIPLPEEEPAGALPPGEGSHRDLSSRYVIQTISTSNRNDASVARNRIMAEGFPAGIFEADLGEKGRWYRVYVGPYENEAEAQVVLESVRRIPGFKASFVKSLE